MRYVSRLHEILGSRNTEVVFHADALSIAALTHIIIDVSHRDSKMRNVLDIPETRDEVFKSVIGAAKVLQGLRQGKIQLVLL